MKAEIERLIRLEEEHSSLQARVEILALKEAEVQQLQSRISAMESASRRRDEAWKTERERHEGTVAELRRENSRLMEEAHEAVMENIYLKGFISSKHCHWKGEF